MIGRANRRKSRETRIAKEFGAHADAALSLLELTELAWHDCYGEETFSDQVLDDLLVCGRGNLADLIFACRTAVTDWRDLRVNADSERARR